MHTRYLLGTACLLAGIVLSACGGSGPLGNSVGGGVIDASEVRNETSAANVATTTTSIDPALGRPLWTEFSLLSFMDDEVAGICSRYPTIMRCYDAVERDTPNFEQVVRARVRAALDSGSGYQSNQYGCHSDGRCLDIHDEWCDESEYDSEYERCYGYGYDDDEYD